MTVFSRGAAPNGFRAVMLALACAGMAGAACAADATALLTGEGTQITSVDVLADAQRLPPNVHDSFLAKPDNVKSLARNLYVRRVMAERAKAEGIEKDAEVAAAVQIAVDKVLSDAYLKVFNAKHQPSAQAVDAQVRTAYQAKKESFVKPEQVHVAHVLIGMDTPDAEAKAQKLLASLRDGADFAEAAKTQSADPGSAARGGDLGWVVRGRMVPEFEQSAFALKKPGELSGLVKSQFGYHIIKLLDRKTAGQQTLEEVRPQLEQEVIDKMLAESRSEEVSRVTKQLKTDDAAIEAFAHPFADKASAKK